MKNPTPYISEEHIVAWLDGEMNTGADFDAQVKENPELASATNEYSGLSRAFSRTRDDKRFSLKTSVDTRVRASLASEIARTRKVVRIPERAPLAEPMRSVPAPRKIWVRRSVFAMAFASLLMVVWFGTRSNDTEQLASSLTSGPAATTAPAVTTPAPATTQPAGQTIPNQQPSVAPAVQPVPVRSTQAPVRTTQISTPSHPMAEATQTQTTVEAVDPAAIMASHRFAKLIKATPTVVVTQQDRM